MIGSIWSGASPYQGYSLTETQKEREQKAADAAANLFDPVHARKEEEKEATRTAENLGVSLDNNVKATIYAGQIATAAEEETTLPTGGTPSASGTAATGAEEEDTTEVIYKTIVLADGSKLLQIITKYPDGKVTTVTTKVPGAKGDESSERREKLETKPAEGEKDGSLGHALADAVGLDD